MDDIRKKVYWNTSSKHCDNNYVTGNHHICKPSNLQALKCFYSPRRLFFSLQVHYISVSDINNTFFCNLNLFFNSDISVGKKHFHGEMNKICEIVTKAIVLPDHPNNIYFHNHQYHHHPYHWNYITKYWLKSICIGKLFCSAISHMILEETAVVA